MEAMTKLHPSSIPKEIKCFVCPVQRQVLGEMVTSTYFLTDSTTHYPRKATRPGWREAKELSILISQLN